MSHDATDKRASLVVWGALAIVYVVWGSTYLAIRITIETIPPLLSGAMRFTTAALVLGVVIMLLRGPRAFRMTLRQFGGAALVGLLLLTAGNGMVALAEQHISSGLAALLVASVPLWLVVLRLVARDRPQVMTLTGVLIGFGGVAVLSLTGGGGSSGVSGIVIVLLASLSWSVGSFLSSRIPMPADPFAASAVEMLVGGVGLTLTSRIAGEPFDLATVSGRSWAALAYLVVMGSLVAFTAYIWLLGSAPISLVSTYAYVNPVVAVLLGALVLGEPVTGSMVVAGLVIVVGVALVVSTERGKKAQETPEEEPAPV
ncbi:drug/metabolite exporter YedA [Streptosporangium carneum]|uniref:Drug/metabolite exporter YedA n=1 Tax=Streptosporangium carneum TaxID=47481 RepID=A0A9W6HWG1_9ACTN|nr:drug/metabolite exporter YedA [Streptosporangium carneum]